MWEQHLSYTTCCQRCTCRSFEKIPNCKIEKPFDLIGDRHTRPGCEERKIGADKHVT